MNVPSVEATPMADREYDGLLLDHDGVVVTIESASTLRDAARAAFADVGVSEPRPEDVDTVSIDVSIAALNAVADRYGVAPERLWRRREDRIEASLRAAVESGRKTPYDDVSRLEEVGVPLGIVSNNQARIVEFVLRSHGLREHFGTVRARPPTVESLRRKKPEPTYLEAAAADLGFENPLYVGDSESDVLAGRRAGIDTVFLRRSHNAARQLDAEPTVEAGGLGEILEMLRRSE